MLWLQCFLNIGWYFSYNKWRSEMQTLVLHVCSRISFTTSCEEESHFNSLTCYISIYLTCFIFLYLECVNSLRIWKVNYIPTVHFWATGQWEGFPDLSDVECLLVILCHYSAFNTIYFIWKHHQIGVWCLDNWYNHWTFSGIMSILVRSYENW